MSPFLREGRTALLAFEQAAASLTAPELAAWLLADRGMSQRNIALALGVSRSTIRSRLENAARKLANAQKEPAA
jgi:DNA-directed RNA polymerase specialized sigma24 family protein